MGHDFDPRRADGGGAADEMDREEVGDGGRKALLLNWLKMTRGQMKNWKKWGGRERSTPVLRGAVSPSQPQQDDDDRHLSGH